MWQERAAAVARASLLLLLLLGPVLVTRLPWALNSTVPHVTAIKAYIGGSPLDALMASLALQTSRLLLEITSLEGLSL